MKKLIVFAVAAVVAASAFAASIEDSFIVANGTWYTGNSSYEQEAGFFNGNDLGVISSLILGAELKDYGEGDAAANPLMLNYSIDLDPQAEVWQSGAIAYEGWNQDGGYNLFKQTDAINVDLSGLDEGKHDISIYFSKQTDGGETIYNNPAGGGNYKADFTYQAVPEPATMSLLGLGALAMVLRRKLRK